MSQAGNNNVSANPSVPIQFTTNSGVAVPAANNLNVLGAGSITTSGAGSTVTISVSGSGITWSTISASQTLAVQHGYFCISPGGALSLLLPATSVIGDIIEVTLDGATSFVITQGAGQSIRLGNLSTTAGVGGTLTTTQQGDTVYMVCQTANLKWNVLSSMGNLLLA